MAEQTVHSLSVGDIADQWGAPVQIMNIQDSSSGKVATIMYLCNPDRPDEGDYYAGLQRMIPLSKLESIGALSEGVKARMDRARNRALQLVQGINKAQVSEKGQGG